MTLLQKTKQYRLKSLHRFSHRYKLCDGATTPIHVVRYDRAAYSVKVIAFSEATYFLDWCARHEIDEALGGSFFDREAQRTLGDCWIDGTRQPHTPFQKPWDATRGCLMVGGNQIAIAQRLDMPKNISGSLLQAGPILVEDGRNIAGDDIEGFSAGCHQFDSDITNGRYPRSAIGYSENYIWSVVCDGYNNKDAGLTFVELAELMLSLGAEYALNLDGGGSNTQISEGKLRNHPRTRGYDYPAGRPIYSGIVFNKNV